jgi:UDP-N-acetyl-2-amino-2-deoxyglucuronate dehydrogenase
MLKKEELGLISLCAPSGIHANQTELCAQYGVNVITEKPMARGNQLEERVCRGL